MNPFTWLSLFPEQGLVWATILLVIVTFMLVVITWLYTRQTKKMANVMYMEFREKYESPFEIEFPASCLSSEEDTFTLSFFMTNRHRAPIITRGARLDWWFLSEPENIYFDKARSIKMVGRLHPNDRCPMTLRFDRAPFAQKKPETYIGQPTLKTIENDIDADLGVYYKGPDGVERRDRIENLFSKIRKGGFKWSKTLE